VSVARPAGSPRDSIGPYLDLPSPEDRLARALAARTEAPSPLPAGQRATVVFDAGHAAWTVMIDGPRMQLVPGRVAAADATVRADAATLADVVEGLASGADAFLNGRLRLRGNMALTMQLEGVDHPERPARFPRARSVRALDIETFYLEAGVGSPVVLLHGLGATSASMLPTLVDLAHDHRVLAVDLPGFGASDKPVQRYDAAFFGRWLSAFLDALGIRRAVLIGNSMGGRIAIEAGLSAPERVERIALFAPSLAFKRFREATPLVRLLAAELGAMPMLMPRPLVNATLRMMFARPERLSDAWYDAAADEFLRVFASRRGRIAFFSAAREIYLEEAVGDGGFWKRLPALACPALFIWGRQDQLVPWRFAPHVEAVLPRVRSVVFEDCGHVPQFEQPERTHALVREFLGRPR
jgi:pimeloyl-ACP methyl ester carboxylesterase